MKALEMLREKLAGRIEGIEEEAQVCVHCGEAIVRGNPREFRNGWAHRDSQDDICELYAEPRAEANRSAA